MQNEKQRSISTPSLLDGDFIVETVASEGRSVFCVGNGDEYKLLNHYEMQGIKYIPISKDSNLVSSGIITFPGEPLSYDSEAGLQLEIARYISNYVTLSPDFVNLLSTYIMLTWMYDVFNEMPYIRFQGDFGSGKTRALLVSGSLCYKSFNAGGASTISPIFHILDKFKGTLILDEADFRFTDETNEIVKILNNGNQRGFPVLRSQMNMRKEFEPRAFSVYGPKIIAMRGSYQDIALESRFLTEPMGKGNRHPSVPSQLPEKMSEEAAILRRKLLSYRLRNRFHPFAKGQVQTTALPDRITQIITPLLLVAPSEEVKDSIIRVASKGAESLSFERGWSFEAQVVSALIVLMQAGTPLTVSEITKALRSQAGRENDKSLSPTLIGRTLRNKLGLMLYKTRGVITVHPGQEAEIEKLRQRYGE